MNRFWRDATQQLMELMLNYEVFGPTDPQSYEDDERVRSQWKLMLKCAIGNATYN